MTVELDGIQLNELSSLISELKLLNLDRRYEESVLLLRRVEKTLIDCGQPLSPYFGPWMPPPYLDIRRGVCREVIPLVRATLKALVGADEANALTAVNNLESKVKELNAIYAHNPLVGESQ